MKKLRKSTSCFNCDSPLLNRENFCPNCGQENHTKQATVKQLSSDFLGDYLSFDSRLFRSIVPLILRPGQVTLEYLDGKRQRFIPPIRLFLFLSFLYFGLSIFAGEVNLEISNPDDETAKIIERVTLMVVNRFNIIVLLYIPLFAVLIMPFFRSKERHFFVNFFVYALHLFSFFFILGISLTVLFTLIDFIPNETAVTSMRVTLQIAAFVYIITYALVSLKKVFNKRYTALRFIAVLLISALAFVLLLFIIMVFLLALNR